MAVHEYDVLEIPEEYKKMSLSELEKEKERLLNEIKAQEGSKKQVKASKRKTELFAEMIARREYLASHKVSVKSNDGKLIAKVEKKECE